MAEGLAVRLLADDVPEALEGRGGLRARHGRRCSPARASAATSRSASRRSSRRSPRGRRPILFIDEIHSTVGAGATTGGTMDLATLIKPMLTAGELRVIGSTTFDEFKHIEKDRALARRLQKIAIDEPSIDETVKILAGLRSRYEEHHRVNYTDAALEAAVKLAARHLRDYRLPDSAIDLHRRSRIRRAARGAAGAGRPTPPAEPRSCPAVPRRRGCADIERDRRAHRAHPGAPGLLVGSRAAADARGVAAARRLRPGRSRAPGRAGDQALARRPRPAGSAGRLLPLHRPDRRRQDRARQAARDSARQRVHRAST